MSLIGHIRSIFQFPRKSEETIEEKILRGVRRIHLIAESNAAMLARMDEKNDDLVERLTTADEASPYSYSLNENEIINIMDEAHNLLSLADLSGYARQRVEFILERISCASGVVPISHIDQPCDMVSAEIVEIAPSEGGRSGLVANVIVQGYRRSDGSIIRRSKVVASANCDEFNKLEG